MDAMPPIVRLYRSEDRAAVLQIAADTGFFGAPVEAFMQDRRMMQDVFVAYYIDREPEHLWVADVDGAVVGYISGSTGGAAATWGRGLTAAAAAMRLVTFRYDVNALTLRYFRRTAGAVLSGEYPHVDLRDYPAELHINLAEAARGLGLGRKLMQACLDQMSELGIPGIHLKTTTMNAAAIKLYEKLGFELLGRKRTHLWDEWLSGEEIENLVYGKRLGRGMESVESGA
jgi:ribosomal protein S18 acetylase RimI-like enzyme